MIQFLDPETILALKKALPIAMRRHTPEYPLIAKLPGLTIAYKSYISKKSLAHSQTYITFRDQCDMSRAYEGCIVMAIENHYPSSYTMRPSFNEMGEIMPNSVFYMRGAESIPYHRNPFIYPVVAVGDEYTLISSNDIFIRTTKSSRDRIHQMRFMKVGWERNRSTILTNVYLPEIRTPEYLEMLFKTRFPKVVSIKNDALCQAIDAEIWLGLIQWKSDINLLNLFRTGWNSADWRYTPGELRRFCEARGLSSEPDAEGGVRSMCEALFRSLGIKTSCPEAP